MRRLLLLFIFMGIFCSFAFADVVIEATGTGKTKSEAEENARKQLAEKVFPGIVVSVTETSSSANNKSSSSSFSQNSTYTVVGELTGGLEYTIIKAEKNKYEVSAKIVGNSSTLDFYYNKANDNKNSIVVFYQRYKGVAFNTSLRPEEVPTEKRKFLYEILRAYCNYNLYANVYSILGGGALEGLSSDIPSFEVIKYDYKSALDEENNKLSELSDLSKTSADVKKKLEENKKAQEQYDAALKEAEAQAELNKQRVIQDSVNAVVEGFTSKKTTERVNSSAGFDEVYSYIEAVVKARMSFIEAVDEYEKMREAQKVSIDDALERETNAIYNRVYPLSQQVNGQPTDRAKNLRKKEVSELKEKKEAELEKAYKIIDDSMCSLIQQLLNSFVDAIKLLEAKEFTISNATNELEIETVRYNGESYNWIIPFRLNHPALLGEYQVELPYSLLTGDKVPTSEAELDDFIASDKYESYVNQYNTVLNSDAYDFSLTFNMDFNLEGEYLITFSGYTISFADRDLHLQFDQKNSNLALVLTLAFDRKDFNYDKYSWLDTSALKEYKKAQEVKTTSKTTTTKSTSSSSATNVGKEFTAQAYCSVGFPDHIESSISSSDMFYTIDALVDGRVTFGDASFSFFLSLSPFFRFGSITEGGILLGLGCHFGEDLTLGLRFGIDASTNSGLMGNPYISAILPSEGGDFDLETIFGLFIDPSCELTYFSVGVGALWK